MSVGSNDALAEGRETLARLGQEADHVRAELQHMRQALAEVHLDISDTRVERLRDANEKLVLAALHADTIAETAVVKLQALTRASQKDVLTGTPNRMLMQDRIENAIGMARRHGTRVAVLFLDLDGFKQINDRLGHAVGDEVLKLGARRFESAVRDCDTVSRNGGDEFLILLAEIAEAGDAGVIAGNMLQALAAPCRIGRQDLALTASIGIAIFPEDGKHAATLVNRADRAMYRSKRRGPGHFAFHGQRAPAGHHASPACVDQPAAAGETATSAVVLRSQLSDMREVNGQLVTAALTAQELEGHARQAHRQQIRFMSMVAHEMRNPLTPIRIANDMLYEARADESKFARLRGIIEGQVVHMTRLVEDLLDGARVSMGKLRLELGRVELADMIALAVDTCSAAMASKGQSFSLQLPPGALEVQGDRVRLAQVFSNLLDNASKYTPRGGAIALSVTRHVDAIEIAVTDTGRGIAAELLPVIFDLFVQDPDSLVSNNRGLGIGLAVVRELVEAHGGTVVVTSPGAGLGSTFVVMLPVAAG